MDVALLHNTSAGKEDHTRDKLMRLLKRHGYRATYANVKEGLKDEALLKRSEIVIAAGGDGTVRKVVTRLAGRGCPVGILPLGTANNIARSLGIEGSADKIVAGWKTTRSRAIDLGVAKGPWGRTVFVEGLGFGLMSRAISILTHLYEQAADEFGEVEEKLLCDLFVLATLAHELQPVKARWSINGRTKKENFLLFEILNIGRAGPGVRLTREANPGDGWLNTARVTVQERVKLVTAFEKIVAGQREGLRLRSLRIRKLRLVVDPCELRIDDKIILRPKDFRKLRGGRAKIDITIERAAINVLV